MGKVEIILKEFLNLHRIQLVHFFYTLVFMLSKASNNILLISLMIYLFFSLRSSVPASDLVSSMCDKLLKEDTDNQSRITSTSVDNNKSISSEVQNEIVSSSISSSTSTTIVKTTTVTTTSTIEGPLSKEETTTPALDVTSTTNSTIKAQASPIVAGVPGKKKLMKISTKKM